MDTDQFLRRVVREQVTLHWGADAFDRMSVSDMKLWVEQLRQSLVVATNESSDTIEVCSSEPSHRAWVLDKDGDVWCWSDAGGGWVCGIGSQSETASSWSHLLKEYAPLDIMTRYARAERD